MVLLTIGITCIFLSEVTRVLFFTAAGVICVYEYSRGLEKINVYCAAWVMCTYVVIQALLALFHFGTIAYLACMAGGVYLALFSGILHPKVRGQGAIYTLAGLAYPSFLFGVLMIIVTGKCWLTVLTLACFSTWVCDSCALGGGTRFGKHKLAPDVSPKKTVEGSICGAVGGTLTGLVIYLIPGLCDEIPLWLVLLTCFVASSVGQIGDLAESLIKRMLNIKDFSNLIPGHGGMFDRADSLLFSIPTAYLCLFVFGYAL